MNDLPWNMVPALAVLLAAQQKEQSSVVNQSDPGSRMPICRVVLSHVCAWLLRSYLKYRLIDREGIGKLLRVWSNWWMGGRVVRHS